MGDPVDDVEGEVRSLLDGHEKHCFLRAVEVLGLLFDVADDHRGILIVRLRLGKRIGKVGKPGAK